MLILSQWHGTGRARLSQMNLTRYTQPNVHFMMRKHIDTFTSDAERFFSLCFFCLLRPTVSFSALLGFEAVPKAGGGVEGALDGPLLPCCYIYLPHH